MNGAQAPTTKPTVVHRTQRKDEILLLHTTESVAYKRAHHHQGPERWSRQPFNLRHVVTFDLWP